MIGLSALLLASQNPPPATPPQNPPPQTFRTGTRTVPVYASVTDEFGHFVLDLKKEDFEVRDNGQLQDVTFFSREVQPITAVLMLDGSASVLPALTREVGAAESFVLRMLPGDKARIGSFSEDIRLTPAFSGDRDELIGLLRNEFNITIGRRTRLWDGIDEAISALTAIEGRRVVIVISDGYDTWSVKPFDDVLTRARDADVMVYTVALRDAGGPGQRIEMQPGQNGSSPGRRSRFEPADAFQVMARDTGGGSLEIHESDDLNAPFTEVALELHSQYVIGFTPAVLDGKVHKLEVKVKPKGLKTHARQTYVASADKK